jgi:hypothetical protein
VKIYLQRTKHRDLQGDAQASMLTCILASSWRRRSISRLDGKASGFLENPQGRSPDSGFSKKPTGLMAHRTHGPLDSWLQVLGGEDLFVDPREAKAKLARECPLRDENLFSTMTFSGLRFSKKPTGLMARRTHGFPKKPTGLMAPQTHGQPDSWFSKKPTGLMVASSWRRRPICRP